MKTVRDCLEGKNQQEVGLFGQKATVFEALALMGEKEIGALMVIDEQGR
jgi:predicted transcriptional regulator